jgi:hypothetical protein
MLPFVQRVSHVSSSRMTKMGWYAFPAQLLAIAGRTHLKRHDDKRPILHIHYDGGSDMTVGRAHMNVSDLDIGLIAVLSKGSSLEWSSQQVQGVIDCSHQTYNKHASLYHPPPPPPPIPHNRPPLQPHHPPIHPDPTNLSFPIQPLLPPLLP